tara:strand:- start:1891 stop:2967 length:1077 start_codon:yes stop_codon:yes gene_type:complete
MVYKMLRENERHILDTAIDALNKEAGIKVHVRDMGFRLGNIVCDVRLEIGRDRLPAYGEIKQRLQQTNLGAIIDQLRKFKGQARDGHPWILIADYVNPNMAQELRTHEVQFMDTVGNAFLKTEDLHVFIRGNKQQQALKTKETNRAFEPTGLRVIYAFLKNPNLVNQPYRVIAEQTGVAVGTVGWVMYGLNDGGYLRDLGRKRGKKLLNVTKLFYRWAETYPEKLKKKLELGEWIAGDRYWWKNTNIADFGGYWGGEIAGAKLTNNLNPLVATIYLPKDRLDELAQAKRLKRAKEGTIDKEQLVKIYEGFWKPGINDRDTTDPILTYADLTNTGDPRNMEIAQIVYDKYIDRHLREIT